VLGSRPDAVLEGFEIKRTDTPKVTPSMRIALESLRLDRVDVVHAGATSFPLAPRIRAVAARDLKQIAGSA
jgi:hypothetical protein